MRNVEFGHMTRMSLPFVQLTALLVESPIERCRMNDVYVIGALLLVVLICIVKGVNSQTAKKEIEERQKRNRDDAVRFFVDIEQQKKIPSHSG